MFNRIRKVAKITGFAVINRNTCYFLMRLRVSWNHEGDFYDKQTVLHQ